MQLLRSVPRSYRALFGLLALVGLCLTAAVQTIATSPDEAVGVARLESWKGQVGTEVKTTKGLVFVEWLPEQELTLILMDLPDQGQFILNRRWNVRKGISVLRIVDDATGWWVQMTEKSTLRFDSTEELGRPSLSAQKWNAAEHRVTVQMASAGQSGPLSWSSSLDDPALYPNLFEQLDAEGFAPQLVESMPAETREGVSMLGSLLAANHEDSSLESFHRLVEFLVASLDRHGDRATGSSWRGVKWKRTSLTGQPLRKPLGEDIRSFASNFRQVPAEDPLALVRPPSMSPGGSQAGSGER